MSLEPGSRLGPYRIEREIGRGGMGVVHLARDDRLERAVAVKALPESFALDPDRLARFEREARLLASLHHPNVAGIYGLEEAAGQRYLILEYVEGETLAERLARGPLALDEALEVGRQIALALEAAHEAGIVHRDLKPGNVKLTPAGEVKVLDFGLAKGPAGSPGSSDDLSRSPTLTVAATGMGVILGTAAYMSPEQARGRAVDRRTDIWSFGALLFECLTGEQCFVGETVSDTIARILQGEPEWRRIPSRTPAAVRHLLRRCLEKDARQRLRDIGDARLELESAIATLRSGVVAVEPGTAPMRASRWLWPALAAALGVAAGAGLLALRGTAPPPVVRFPIELPAGRRAAIEGVGEWGDWTISADGSVVAANVWPRDASPAAQTGPRIWFRRLAESEWHPVVGSELARGSPVFSPDGTALLFTSLVSSESQDTRLMRAPVHEPGPAVPVLDLPGDVLGAIPAPGSRAVYFHRDGRRFAVVQLTDRGEPAWRPLDRHGVPGVLDPNPASSGAAPSDHEVFVATTSYDAGGWHRGTARLDLRSGRLDLVLLDGQSPWLLPSGHLLFVRGQTLFAARFDRGRATIRGEAVPLLEGIRARGAWIPGVFVLTRRGDLVYAGGGLVGERRQLGLIGLDGAMTPLSDDERAFNFFPTLSGDGRWASCSATNARGIDELWRIDRSDRSAQRMVAVPDADISPGPFTADGREMLFMRVGAGNANGIYSLPVSGDQDPRPIYLDPSGAQEVIPYPLTVLPGGGRVLGFAGGAVRGTLHSFPLGARPAGPRDLKPVLPGWSVLAAASSWDGRWLGYSSDRSGRPQVYVCPLGPEGAAGAPVLVARSGTQVGWSGDASRLFVLDSTRVKVVRLSGGAAAGPPQVLYDLGRLGERTTLVTFLPDGRMASMIRSADEQELTRLECVQGWAASIRGKLPR